MLTKEGIPTIQGKKKWSAGPVKNILTNEKYKGDALLQKSFTVNFLTKEKKINEGEIPQYYVEKNHEAIIEPKVWDFVQDLLENKPRYNNDIFSSKIVCGCCGSFYGAKTWHSNSKYKITIWRCNNKYIKKGNPCKTPHLYEEDIKKAFINSVNKGHIIEDLKLLEDTFDTSSLNKELQISVDKMSSTKENIEKLIERNSKSSQDQIEYAKKYEKLVNKFNVEKEKYEELCSQIQDKESRKLKYDFFIEKLDPLKPLDVFDPILWNLMLDKMVVNEDGSFEFIYSKGI